jgi:SAM-dependent methyltransferase
MSAPTGVRHSVTVVCSIRDSGSHSPACANWLYNRQPCRPRRPVTQPGSSRPSAAALMAMDRRDAKELLEGHGLPPAIVRKAYRELATVHRWIGNTSAIVERLKAHPTPVNTVLDIGCGEGALLQEIRRRLAVEVIGVDLRVAPQPGSVPIFAGDATRDPLPAADVAVSVCVAHHLSPSDIVRLIHNVSLSSRRLILLDLVRHRVPLLLFRSFVCPLVSEVTACDGVTSFRRAYTARELGAIVRSAINGSGARVVHSVSPFYLRQIVDISW